MSFVTTSPTSRRIRQNFDVVEYEQTGKWSKRFGGALSWAKNKTTDAYKGLKKNAKDFRDGYSEEEARRVEGAKSIEAAGQTDTKLYNCVTQTGNRIQF